MDVFEMNRENALLVTLLIAMMAVSLPAFFGLPLPIKILLLILFVVILSAFGFTHGAQTLGQRGIIVFFTISALVTYLMEWLGTHYGIPFGNYFYTNQLGPMFMDVPIVIPVQWFNILYVSYIMTDIIVSGIESRKGKAKHDNVEESKLSKAFPRMLLISVIVGLLMVSWDFINDPYMVGVGMWVWTDPTEFLGLVLFSIPLSNFLGWILTSVIAVLLFELYWHHSDDISRKTTNMKHARILVLVPYLYMLVFQAINGIVSGVFSAAAIEGLGPILLASASMGLAIAVTSWSYLEHVPN
jgi:uncharacterized membrane protein